MTRFLGFLLLSVALASCGRDADPAAVPEGERMAVRLVAETGTVVPGDTVALAFEMRPAEGWHGYWKNPGDAGAEPQVGWRLPEGFEAGELLYPVPERLTLLGLANYVYEGDYALLAPLRVPATAAPGTGVAVRARLDYLVCTDEVCVPETANVETRLRVAAVRGDPDPAVADHIRALPRPLAAPARFALQDGRLRLAVPLPPAMEVESPYFFPAQPEALDHSAPQSVSRNGGMLIVETAAAPGAASLGRIEGVLRIGERLGLSLAAVPGPVPPAGNPVAAPEEERPAGLASILLALAFALAGGLILNVMPCVFPILSLKALSLARAGETEAAARREALAYAAGVVVTCLALGGLLLALRAGGAAVGWAFQLQEPRVILLLLLLVVAISLNLAGLFRLPALAGGDGLAGSGGMRGAFFTGALAAFVATPCTGPFLGFALGAALILPTIAALAVFAGLGFGLALPFLLLGFVPALRRRLPRPGPWMATFQRILSVPMFLTALGLAWILGRQTGVDGMALGLGAALVLGLALWWLGRRQQSGRAWLPLAPAIVAAAAALLLIRAEAPAAAAGPLPSEPFSEARLAQLRSQGTPVFLYFTADWCLTCKVNEQGALARSDVAAAFRNRGVRVLVGDWTMGDPAIGRFLERHGRSGVPLYLWYPAGGGPPEVLPQILTAGRLVALR